MPRWRSSGALSISAKLLTWPPPPFLWRTLEIAAVSVVFPWSMCPIVPTLRCGFVRSDFCLAISLSSFLWLRARALLGDLGGDVARRLFVPVELHGEVGAPLRHRPEVGGVAEHLAQRHECLDDLSVADGRHVLDAAAAGVEIAHDVAEVVLGRRHLDRHHRLPEAWLRAVSHPPVD